MFETHSANKISTNIKKNCINLLHPSRIGRATFFSPALAFAFEIFRRFCKILLRQSTRARYSKSLQNVIVTWNGQLTTEETNAANDADDVRQKSRMIYWFRQRNVASVSITHQRLVGT